MTKFLLLLAILAGAWIWWRRRSAAPIAMPPAEARALLGLDEAADAVQVRDAHRRLIARVHPDVGGSTELATRVNRARDSLLAELNRKGPRASS